MVFLKWIISKVFHISGWRIVGEIPSGVKKAVFIGAPHTSNWDLFYTLGLMFTLNLNFRFVIKKEAMVFPIKKFLLAMGAYPVDRNRAGANSVDQIAKVFNESDECFLCIAPEGTRNPTKKWKSGFYHIAQKAQVPIIVGYLDCRRREVHIGHLLDSNLTEAETMADLRKILKNAVPKNPKNFILY